MRTIWKFTFDFDHDNPRYNDRLGYAPIYLYPTEKVVHVGAQSASDRTPTVWIEVDPELRPAAAPIARLEFVGTGHPAPAGLHEGSAICAHGALVWHVYRTVT